MTTLQDVHRKLITANHILDYHGVVDAYGHISVRHPTDPSVYIMCGYMAPALVSSSVDLIEYHVSDSSTVDPKAAKGYSERFIHGEIFRMYPEVNCVIHSHAEDVLPFVVAGVRMKAVYHMAGFLGSSVPVFDIDPLYDSNDQRDMLVNNAKFGTGLASHFTSDDSTDQPSITHPVVLMRRHGFTAVADSIEKAVYRAIYTKINAAAQTKSLTILAAAGGRDLAFDTSQEASGTKDDESGGLNSGLGLTDEQGIGCTIMNEKFQDKPWKLWVREVETRGIYVNRLA